MRAFSFSAWAKVWTIAICAVLPIWIGVTQDCGNFVVGGTRHFSSDSKAELSQMTPAKSILVRDASKQVCGVMAVKHNSVHSIRLT
jgi:hypothetical protein